MSSLTSSLDAYKLLRNCYTNTSKRPMQAGGLLQRAISGDHCYSVADILLKNEGLSWLQLGMPSATSHPIHKEKTVTVFLDCIIQCFYMYNYFTRAWGGFPSLI